MVQEGQQPSDLRDEHGKHRFEDEGLDIVRAIKRDYLPDMDSNDGGQMLTWILDLCDAVHRSALLSGGPRSPEGPTEEANVNAYWRLMAKVDPNGEHLKEERRILRRLLPGDPAEGRETP